MKVPGVKLSCFALISPAEATNAALAGVPR